MLLLVWRYHLNAFRRYFAVRRTAKLVTAFLFGMIGIGLMMTVFVFFASGLRFIAQDSYFHDALTAYIYEGYTLIVFWLVAFSAVITLLFSLFRSKENDWILASPRFSMLQWVIFSRVVISSLWPLALLFLPGVTAAAIVFHISFWGWFAVLFSVALLTVLAVGSIYALILTLAKFLETLSRIFLTSLFSFRNIVVIVLLLVTALAALTWRQSFNVDLIQLFQANKVGNFLPDVTAIVSRFSFFPSHLVAGTLYNWQQGDVRHAVSLVGMLVSFVLAIGVLGWFTSRWYLSLEQQLRSGTYIAQTNSTLRRTQTARFRGGYIRVLLKKELLMTSRDGRNISWFAFLLLIWLCVVGLNIVLGHLLAKNSIDTRTFSATIQVLQFVTTVYFVSAFALRFVYPALSTERKTAWILASAPIRFSRVYWAKLAYHLVLFTALGVLVGYANLAFLGVSLRSAGWTLLVFLTTLPLLIIFALSLGALFPNFETADPSEVGNSLPGFGFITGSLLYGAAGGWLLYRVLFGGSIVPILGFELVSVLLMIFFLSIAPYAMEKIDFAKTQN